MQWKAGSIINIGSSTAWWAPTSGSINPPASRPLKPAYYSVSKRVLADPLLARISPHEHPSQRLTPGVYHEQDEPSCARIGADVLGGWLARTIERSAGFSRLRCLSYMTGAQSVSMEADGMVKSSGPGGHPGRGGSKSIPQERALVRGHLCWRTALPPCPAESSPA